MDIIIAHEDTILRKKLRQVLEGLGHRVVRESVNGLQAYNDYLAIEADLIFIHIDIPIYNGRQTLERIMQNNPQAFCVVLSHGDDKRKVFKLLDQGARHYLTLPFSPETTEKLMEDIKAIKKEMELSCIK